MQKKISKENNELNSFKTDYKLHTFSNGFNIEFHSSSSKIDNQKKKFLKNKYSPLNGEKLSKKNLNRFNTKPDYINELWNKIISKNLNSPRERCQSEGNENNNNFKNKIVNDKINEYTNININKNKINLYKVLLEKNSHNNENNMICKEMISSPLNTNSLKHLVLENGLDDINNKVINSDNYKEKGKENKDTNEDINNNNNNIFLNNTCNNFYKNKKYLKLKNEIIIPKYYKFNKKYKLLYKNTLSENIILQKENQKLKNKIKEINDEIDIMREEDELNKENIKENENKLSELYKFIKQKINIYEQEILNYKELLLQKETEIERMTKKIEKMESIQNNIYKVLNEQKNKIIVQENIINEFNIKKIKLDENKERTNSYSNVNNNIFDKDNFDINNNLKDLNSHINIYENKEDFFINNKSHNYNGKNINIKI